MGAAPMGAMGYPPQMMGGAPYSPMMGNAPPGAFGQLSPSNPESRRVLLRQQIEFYFSDSNLSHDMFLRGKFDVEGYVPLDTISGFRRIQNITMSRDEVIEAVKESEQLDLDLDNDKLRRRAGWEPFLVNGGQPLHVKAAEGEGAEAGHLDDTLNSLAGHLGVIEQNAGPDDGERCVGSGEHVNVALVIASVTTGIIKEKVDDYGGNREEIGDDTVDDQRSGKAVAVINFGNFFTFGTFSTGGSSNFFFRHVDFVLLFR